jgi:hypothetical protein
MDSFQKVLAGQLNAARYSSILNQLSINYVDLVQRPFIQRLFNFQQTLQKLSIILKSYGTLHNKFIFCSA